MEITTIRVYPWDSIRSLTSRVARSIGVFPRFIEVMTDLDKIRHREATGEEVVEVRRKETNITDPDRRLYLRGLWEDGRLDAGAWEEMFRFRKEEDTGWTSYEHFIAEMEAEKLEDTLEAEAMDRLDSIFEDLDRAEDASCSGWKAEKHRIRYIIQDDRSMGELFDGARLDGKWLLSVYSHSLYSFGVEEAVLFGKTHRQHDPRLIDLWKDGAILEEVREDGVYLFRQDLQPVVLRRREDVLVMEVEIGDAADVLQEALDAFTISSIQVKEKTDVGMIGNFFLRDTFLENAIFQDACMNDPLVSTFFSINESRRSSFDVSLPIVFRPFLRELLGVSTSTPADLILRNIHRQTGFMTQASLVTPVAEERMGLFLMIFGRVMGWYRVHKDEWIREYVRFIPLLAERIDRQKKNLVKNIKKDRHEYFSKYPRMFVRNLYSVLCQKNLQPVILTEDEVGGIPPERIIRFPPESIEEIEPEYYYCPNDDYPHAGLKEMDLKGGDVFINMAPCCFNSPQGLENEKKLANLSTSNKEAGGGAAVVRKVKKDNVITGKFLIKYQGQLGTIRPPLMQRFLSSIDPTCEYYRMGVEQSPSSLLSCILMWRRLHKVAGNPDIETLRKTIADDKDCAPICLQENPGMDVASIRRDMENPRVYFDPRRFYRAIEVFFKIRIVVFTKPPDMLGEEASLMWPVSMRSHYSNRTDIPVVIIFEHWGGKTNILSKFPHPHCELVCYKYPTDPDIKVDFDPSPVFHILDSSRFQFDGSVPVFPMAPIKDIWFYRMIIGQSVDPIGKVRTLEFEYQSRGKTHRFTAAVSPPIAIQSEDNIPFVEGVREASAPDILPFLLRFDSWVKIHIPDPSKSLVYWTVRHDRIFYKSLGESAPLFLTFAVRLPAPRPTGSFDGVSRVKAGGIDRASLPLLETPRDLIPESIRKEKVARCLLDLSIYGFSLFLKKNKIRIDSIDPDTILDAFGRQDVRIDPSYKYPSFYEKEGFFVRDELVLPSKDFWRKIRYNLKWLLFHRASVFENPDPLPSFYKNVYDFSDKSAFYFRLETFDTIYGNAVEATYTVIREPIEAIGKIDKRTLWYNENQSPLPSPLWAITHPTLEAALEDARRWKKTTCFLQWDKDTRRWRLLEGSGRNRAFVARREADVVLLLPLR